MYAIFACQKNKNRAVDPPCLDPLSYGRGAEPQPHLLLRRGRVQLFKTEAEARDALDVSNDWVRSHGFDWAGDFDFLILECNQPPASGEE